MAGFLGLAPRDARSHTPYRQWKVYRARHLMIGCSREDAESYPAAKRLEAHLAEHLPEASARVARARTLLRLGDLLATEQLRIILLDRRYLPALVEGAAPFREPVDLRAVARIGDHVLVTLESFPDAHAWILTDVLTRTGAAVAPHGLSIARHHGTQIALEGGPVPEPPEPAAVEPEPHHH